MISKLSIRESAHTVLAGKGFYGHKGRPGKRGGSLPRGGGGGWPKKWEKYRSAPDQGSLSQMGISDYLDDKISKDDIKKIQDLWDKDHEVVEKKITQDEAIGLYTENSALSTSLRKGRELEGIEKQIVEHLDTAMEPVSQDTDLFRFVVVQDKSDHDAIYGQGGTRVGNEFSDSGYASTAESVQKAWKFNKEGAQLWRISLKKGQKALDLRGKGSWGTEGELLLPRGTKFKVSGREYDEGLDMNILNLEVM